MRTLQDHPIHMPPQLGELVDAAAADPAVRSVVLYGSRSIGKERPASDWDIALVTDGASRPAKGIMDAGWRLSPKHGLTVVSEKDMLAKKDVYASLPSEICLGVLLRGVNYELEDPVVTSRRTFGNNTQAPQCRSLAAPPLGPAPPSLQGTAPRSRSLARVCSTEEARASYVGMMESMWEFLRQDMMRVNRCKRAEHAVVPTGLGSGSADAAERAVKLATLAHGLPFQASHDVHELAERLPDEWRKRLEALNGDTQLLHQATYALLDLDEAEARQVCEATERRMRLTLDVIDDRLHMPMPLAATDASRLRMLLANPDTTAEVDFMLRQCSAASPQLVAQFEAVRDRWIERLAQPGGTALLEARPSHRQGVSPRQPRRRITARGTRAAALRAGAGGGFQGGQGGEDSGVGAGAFRRCRLPESAGGGAVLGLCATVAHGVVCL